MNIDAEKLKSIIKVQIKERKKWMKNIDRSDRQDQLWSDLNGEDMSILQIIDSLQQEQPEVNLDESINDFLLNNSEFLVERDSKDVVQKLARHFYELGFNARKKE